MELVLALPLQVEGKTEESETNKRRRKGLFGVFEQVGVQWCPPVSSSLMGTRAEETVGDEGPRFHLWSLAGRKPQIYCGMH